MSRAASSMWQSGSAMRWFLAPPRAVQRLLCSWQRLDTMDATGEEPTNVMALWMVLDGEGGRDTRMYIEANMLHRQALLYRAIATPT